MSTTRARLLVCIAALGASLLAPLQTAAATPPGPAAKPAAAANPGAAPPGPLGVETDRSTVAPSVRNRVLPAGWRSSSDLLWTTDGDATGFHLLVAEARTGYTWRTAATLAESWIETDQWVGNACLTGSGRRAVVVYAPRHFTNRGYLFDRGAFAAVVDLATGAVSKLDTTVSLAYYNPGCGTGETAVLTQSAVVDLGKTRLHVVDTARPRITRSHELTGEITSAVPVGDTIVAAAGARLIEVNRTGATRELARTGSVPYRVHPIAGGGLVFTERAGATGVVRRLTGSTVQELARGPLTGIRLVPGTAGRVFLTGAPTSTGALPAAVRVLAAPPGAEVSTAGAASLTRTDQKRSAAARTSPDASRTIALRARLTGTGQTVDFRVPPAGRISRADTQGRAVSPAARSAARGGTAAPGGSGTPGNTGTPGRSGTPGGTGTPGIPRPRAGARLAAESPTDPVDQDRTCSVERNNVRLQVYQPHWAQVEWAADLAVQKALTVTRPANWKQSGLAAWSPQVMFPPVDLVGGGRVPVQILLGILAQESNLWQASKHTIEGTTGNPLIGAYYGVRDGWGIDWANADCGYGVAQVTDGMRRTGGNPLPPEKQRAIAVDYATSIAAGVRILQQKWNQTYGMNIRVNGANPARIESWFAALWAYNSGINPQESTGNTTGCTPGPTCTDPDGNWGLGWTNNPARPDFPTDRGAFLDNDDYEDAKNPQWWPYPEKVIGWAAFPIVKSTGEDTYEGGYAQAWWPTRETRSLARPPLETFCVNDATTGNRCNPADIDTETNPCTRADAHCWWHSPAAWKDCWATGDVCGHETDVLTAPGTPEPPDADAPGAYADETRSRYLPNCSTSGLPSGALIIDNLPSTVPIVRSNCARNWTNSGSFGLNFAQHTDGLYHSKVDFHQIGGGFGGHFWFARTVPPEEESATSRRVTGTWTLNRTVNGWARVLVHLPDHHAHTQQAPYTIHLGNGTTKFRSLPQKTRANKWVALGAFQFAGTPKVSLTNVTATADSTEDIAYDAVAFQLLPGKPADQIVVMGDSYSSGEGAATDAPVDYYRESADDGFNGPAYRNGCHRSRHAWSRQAVLPGTTESVGSRADNFRTNVDYHLIACSGAETENLLPAGGDVTNAFGEAGTGQYRELSQYDKGYLDGNTTMVALTIGGNDAQFAKVMDICTGETPGPLEDCRHESAPWDRLTALEVAIPALINDQVRRSVETAVRGIRERASNARIVLMGYPHLFPPTGTQTSDCLAIGINAFEMEWLNHMADLLNWRLHELAVKMSMEGYQVVYSDPRDEFELKNACMATWAGVDSIHRLVVAKVAGEDPEGLVSAQSFHPKISGHALYGNALSATLRSLRPGAEMPVPLRKEAAKANLEFMFRTYSMGSGSGYDRARFQHWVTVLPGCDGRQAVLRRDNLAANASCTATSGQWTSRYDGTQHTSPSTLQIDHLVSLKEAWLGGASGWTDEQRRAFANDLEHPQLLAVSVSSNTSKGERPPDVWLPATNYWCSYARSWIHTKAMWRLAVTQAEYNTLNDILDTRC